MSAGNAIATARERLIAAALTVAEAVAAIGSTASTVDPKVLAEFQAADVALAEAVRGNRRPPTPTPTSIGVARFAVKPGDDGRTVVLTNADTRVALEPDRARGLAAALTAAAEHVDAPRQLRRRRAVDEALMAREG